MKDRLRYIDSMMFLRHMYVRNGLILWKFDLRLTIKKFLLATRILIRGA